MPVLTVSMNRADPFFDLDATGWQFMNLKTGNTDVAYQLPDSADRRVAFNTKKNRPEDTQYQDEDKRVPAQIR